MMQDFIQNSNSTNSDIVNVMNGIAGTTSTVTNNGRVGIGTYKPTTNLNIIAGNGGGLLMSTYFSGTVIEGSTTSGITSICTKIS